jgi:hypothetical protein
MAYFNELPNLEVVSRFPNQSSNQDYTTIKNIWRRPKLREDIANAITAFNYYQIEDNERPDQIAQKVYGDPELDWVILITNNITNLNEDWPLDNDSLYNYLIEKYGSEENLQKVHHSETVADRDKYNRLVVPDGLFIDDVETFRKTFTTIEELESYEIDRFPSENTLYTVTVNMIQVIYVLGRNSNTISCFIPDILEDFSNIKIKSRDNGQVDVTVVNNLFQSWPTGWGGTTIIQTRDNGNITLQISDVISDVISEEYNVSISGRLFTVKGTLKDGKIVPTFEFSYDID